MIWNLFKILIVEIELKIKLNYWKYIYEGELIYYNNNNYYC